MGESVKELEEVLAGLSIATSSPIEKPLRTHFGKARSGGGDRRWEERHWADRHPYKCVDSHSSLEESERRLKGSDRTFSDPNQLTSVTTLTQAPPLSDWMDPSQPILVLPRPRKQQATCAQQASANSTARLEDLLDALQHCQVSHMSHMALSMYS